MPEFTRPVRTGPGRAVTVSLQVDDYCLAKNEAEMLGVSVSAWIAGMLAQPLDVLRAAAEAASQPQEFEENTGETA